MYGTAGVCATDKIFIFFNKYFDKDKSFLKNLFLKKEKLESHYYFNNSHRIALHCCAYCLSSMLRLNMLRDLK